MDTGPAQFVEISVDAWVGSRQRADFFPYKQNNRASSAG